jgi:1-deoxyxylulose-5-phosphate synthase
MEIVKLGSSGLQVSRICLGTSNFGAQCSEKESHRLLDRAFDLGIRFVDTADVYPAGSEVTTITEAIVGNWLAEHRDEVVIATKCGHPISDKINDGGLSRKHIIESCERSLRRLRSETIDVLYLHVPDPMTPLEETLGALDTLVRSGKVHYVGVSNFNSEQLRDAGKIIGEERLTRFSSLLTRHSLLFRDPEERLIPAAAGSGIAVFTWNALAGGLLTGKYDRDSAPPGGSRFADETDFGDIYRNRYWGEHAFDVVDAVKEVAHDERMTPAQVALAWTLSRAGVTGALVGASRPEQLEDVVVASDRKLSDESLKRLDSITELEKPPLT